MAKRTPSQAKEVTVAVINAKQGILIAALTSISAVTGASLPAWWASSDRDKDRSLQQVQKNQDLNLAQSQLALESADKIAHFKDDLLSANSAKRLVAKSTLLAILHPTVAEKFFASLAKQTGDELGEWKEAQAEARSLGKLLPVYHFAVMPLPDVAEPELEKLITKSLFSDIQVYKRNVRSTLHSLSKVNISNGHSQYLWRIELDLVAGTAEGAEDSLVEAIKERLKEHATVMKFSDVVPRLE